jgi:hypothetical protein
LGNGQSAVDSSPTAACHRLSPRTIRDHHSRKKETMMNGTKNVLQSRTVWASLVGIAFAMLDAFNLDLGVNQQQVLETVWKTGEVAAFATAIWGRIVADKMIGAR